MFAGLRMYVALRNNGAVSFELFLLSGFLLADGHLPKKTFGEFPTVALCEKRFVTPSISWFFIDFPISSWPCIDTKSPIIDSLCPHFEWAILDTSRSGMIDPNMYTYWLDECFCQESMITII